MHILPKVDNNDESIYGVSVNINKHNIDIEKWKEMGYSDAFLADVLKPNEENISYSFPKSYIYPIC